MHRESFTSNHMYRVEVSGTDARWKLNNDEHQTATAGVLNQEDCIPVKATMRVADVLPQCYSTKSAHEMDGIS